MDVSTPRERLLGAVRQFTPAQAVVAGLLVVLVLGAGVAFVRWVTAPTMSVLVTGLDPSDTSAVTAQLTTDGVPYTLGAGGTSVLVPAEQVDASRVALAGAGLPKGASAGWELLDEQGLTSSSFQQEVAYQRALEGELARSLTAFEGVTKATVHLALPEETLYSDEEQPRRASVLLDTERPVDSDTVDAVVHLVAAGVPELDPSDVSVSDTDGRLLTSGDGGAAGTGGGDRAAMEDLLAARATSMLDQVVGPGRAVVRVAAELDTATTETEAETYRPDQQVPLRSETSRETYEGADPATQGVVAGETPPIDPAQGAGGSYEKADEATEFGVGRNVERTNRGPGGVRRLTVAVAVDSGVPTAPQQAQLTELVGNAVGLDPARGDTITVTSSAFPVADEPAEKEGGGGIAAVLGSSASTVAGVLVLLAVGAALLRASRGPRFAEAEVVDLDAAAPAGELGRGTAALEPGEGAGDDASADERRQQEAAQTTAVPEQRPGTDGLLAAVDGRPDAVGALLAQWLAEDGDRR